MQNTSRNAIGSLILASLFSLLFLGCTASSNPKVNPPPKEFGYVVQDFRVISLAQPEASLSPELIEDLKYQVAAPLLYHLNNGSFDSAKLVLKDTVLKQTDGGRLKINAEIDYGLEPRTGVSPDDVTDIPEYPSSEYLIIRHAALPYHGLLNGDLYVTEAGKNYRIPVDEDHMMIPIGIGKTCHPAGMMLQKAYWLSLVE